MVSDPIAGRAAGTRTPPTFDVIHTAVEHVVKVGMKRYVNQRLMPPFMLEASVVQERARAGKSYDGQDVPLERVDLVLAAQALIADAALVAFPHDKQGYIMVGTLHRGLPLTERARRIAQAQGKTKRYSGKHWLDTHRRGDVEQIAQALYRAFYYSDQFAVELVEARKIAGLTAASSNN